MLVSPVQVWASAPSPLGDRLTAGLRTLDPSIGVRIPVPQPCDCEYGGHSSAVEHQIVALGVVGSIPTGRPTVLQSASPRTARFGAMRFLRCRAAATPHPARCGRGPGARSGPRAGARWRRHHVPPLAWRSSHRRAAHHVERCERRCGCSRSASPAGSR